MYFFKTTKKLLTLCLRAEEGENLTSSESSKVEEIKQRVDPLIEA
jgi:hypothetical protein